MAFTDLKNDFVGAFENAANAIGVGSAKKYPGSLDRVTNVIDENDRSWKKSVGYSFKVVRVKDGAIFEDASPSGGLAGGGDSWQEFILQINPQELVQDEIFAIEVTPTFSGVFVEHQGITLKDIRISGTTGLSPNRKGFSGSYPQSGRPVAGSGRSGYAEFHELRNYIRTYVEAKRTDQNKSVGELRLVWTNLKDHESLFVEPQKFTMKRSRSKPFLYDYDIQLKAIGVADFKPTPGGFFETLDAILEGVGDLILTGTKLLQGGIDFLERIDSEIQSTIITPALNIRDGLRARNQFGNRLDSTEARLSRLSIKNLQERIDSTTDNANDFLGRDTDAYNEAKGRTKTFVDGLSRPPTDSEFQGLNGLIVLRKALDHLIGRPELFDDFVDDKANAINEQYSTSRSQKIIDALKREKLTLERQLAVAQARADTAKVAEINTSLEAVATEAAAVNIAPVGYVPISLTRQAIPKVVEGNDTVQTLASRYLGSVDRWKDIVLLNNLIYPYIEQDIAASPVAGVLRVGDIIYIPSEGGSETDTNISDGFDAPVNKSLTTAERKLGVDLKLNDEFDLEISPIGDFELAAATENVAQALTLKLLYNPGDLKRHPDIGTDLQIGSKSVNVQTLANQVRSTMLSDPRVRSVIYVEVTQESNIIRINMILSLAGLQQPVPLQIEV